jgi:hypothetical protein
MNEAAARIAETVMRRPVKFHNGFQGKEKTGGKKNKWPISQRWENGRCLPMNFPELFVLSDLTELMARGHWSLRISLR